MAAFKCISWLLLLLFSVFAVNKVDGQTYNVYTWAGTGVNGAGDGQRTTATFSEPFGIDIDSNDNVYITDLVNHRIRKITASTNQVSTYAGSGGATWADGQDVSASFYQPFGITLDPAGKAFVTDRVNNRIRQISTSRYVSTFAGSGAAGFAGGQGAAATFSLPNDIAMDNTGNLYVTELNNHAIRKITPGGFVTTLAGSGAPTYADGQGSSASFHSPHGISYDKLNNLLYVADYWNRCVRKVTIDGDVTTYAGNRANGASDGPASSASFVEPVMVKVDVGGNVFVTDYNNHRVRMISPSRVVSTIAGTGVAGYNDAAGVLSAFNRPTGMAVDSPGNIIVGEAGNRMLRRIVICSSTAIYDSTTKACTCNLGYQLLSNGTCSLCPVGTESSSDKKTCVSCSAGKYRSLALTSCAACSAGTEPNSDSSACICTSGKYLSGGACVDCALGTEPNTDRTACVACVSGKFRPFKDFGTCQSCPLFASCNATSIVSCASGYKINSAKTACEQCPIGTQSSGDFLSCVSCTIGTNYRSLLTQYTCQSCPSNAACSSATGFTCNAGYEPSADGTSCSQCQDGYSKAVAGNTACTQCVIGTESVSNKQSCVACGSGKYRPLISFNKCVPCPANGACTATVLTCNAGYALNTNGDGCDQCSVGQQSNVGFTACVSCTVGTNYRSSLTQSACQSCPANSVCSTSTSFTCNAGYEPTLDGTGCSQCQEGYSKATSGNSVCTQCSIGTESAANKQSCTACGSGKYRPNTEVNKCIPCPPNGVCNASTLQKCINGWKINSAGDGCDQCLIGQESDGLTCVNCQTGYLKPDQSYSTCIQCPQGYSSCGISSIACQVGYFFDTNAQCKRNDTYFALQQAGTTNTAPTVTNYVTITQTSVSTSTTTATSITSIYATVTASNNLVSFGASATITQTITVKESVPSIGQQAQTANSVSLDFVGITLPVSPLIFSAATFGAGLFIMLILSLICCRRSPSRRKDEEFDGGMTTTGINTTSQRTFTNTR